MLETEIIYEDFSRDTLLPSIALFHFQYSLIYVHQMINRLQFLRASIGLLQTRLDIALIMNYD